MKLHQRQQKKQRMVFSSAVGAVLALCGNALAAPVLTSVSAGPQAPDPVFPGSNATYVVTVNRTGNGNMDVYLSVSGLPAGVGAAFSPNPVHFTSSTPISATANLVVTTTGSTPPGCYPLTIVADDGGSQNIVTTGAALDVGLRSAGIARMANGRACIGFDSTSGQACSIQATTNLAAPVWTTICLTNSGTNSLLVFVDQDAPKYPCRFYRLSTP